MDIRGQYSIEYILLLGFCILLAFSMFPLVYDINELNNIMAAAHSGAILGTEMDSMAIYPRETFENYVEIHPRLKTGSKVIFIGAEYEKGSYNPRYKKNKLKVKIYASAPSLKYYDDRNCLGDRINYHVRKSICDSFKTENLTNIYYNPAFSDRYYITTAEVEWV